MELIKYFTNLYENKKQLALLSYTYLILAVVFVIVAGICALVNQEIGVKMLYVPLIAGGILFANIVVWALVRFLIDSLTEHYEAKDFKAEQKALAAKTKKSNK